MAFLVALGGVLLSMSLTGVFLERSRPVRFIAYAAAIFVLVLPFAVPREPILGRTLIALVSVIPSFRAYDLVRDPRRWPIARRIWHVASPFDSRETKRVTPALDGRLVVVTAVHGLVSIASLAILERFGDARLVRIYVGGALTFGVASFASALLCLVYRCLGIHVPSPQNAPILSRSLGEFWARRWNRAVGQWLRRHCFQPVARRRGATAGAMAAFTASAILHWWLGFAAVGFWPALQMGSFFLAHAGLVLVEERLGTKRWRPWAGRLWTFACFGVTLPLFSEPAMAMVGL